MKKSISILISIGSFVAGGAVGFFLGKKAIADKCTKDIEEMRVYYESKCKSDGSKIAKEIISKKIAEDEISKAETAKVETPAIKVTSSITQMETNTIDYTQFSKPDKVPSAKIVEQEYNCELIDEDDFDSDEVFKDEELYYYVVDGVLADAEDQIVSLDLIGGEEIMSQLPEKMETSLFFVRNSEMETNYQVVMRDMSYSEDILGHPGIISGRYEGGVND